MNDVRTLAFDSFDTLWRPAGRRVQRRVKSGPAFRHSIRTMTAPDDYSSKVVAIAQSGDKAAFAALFGHYAPRIKGFYMRAGLTPGQAEELAQETMLTVWRKAHLFDAGKASASTWIFTIARNLRIDAIRRERYPAAHLMEENEPELEPSPADSLLQLEDEKRVRTAIQSLSPDQMNVIRLHYFDEKPHSEIAKVLDLPLGTIKSRLRLAVQRLRTLLGEE